MNAVALMNALTSVTICQEHTDVYVLKDTF